MPVLVLRMSALVSVTFARKALQGMKCFSRHFVWAKYIFQMNWARFTDIDSHLDEIKF